MSANVFPKPESKAPLWPRNGRTMKGRRKSGPSWIAVSVAVCALTYGVYRTRIRRIPKSRMARL